MSSHYGEDDLILYYYGEGRRRGDIDRHLESCAACAAAYRDLSATLQLVTPPETPERGDQYGGEVWQRIRHRLPERDTRWFRSFGWDRLVVAGAVAALCLVVAAAFTAGLLWPRNQRALSTASEATVDPRDADARARMAAIGDHLERSERVLLDVVNANGQTVDLRAAQAWAADLIDANRLYRAAASRAGDAIIADVLDDLERRLLEIVHGPSKPTLAQLNELRLRLDAATLLFKVRVLHDELRERETAPAIPRTRT
jgi:hypothetical protein